MIKFFSIIFILFCSQLSAQVIFTLDFEDEKAPQDWVFSDKSEWGHLLGEAGSNYFRFHPFSNRDVLQSPSIALSDGVYVLYFSWNETGNVNPNFVNIRIKKNNQSWQEIYDFGGSINGGTNRTWHKDSVVIGALEADNYTFQFEYKSDGKFPSQYMNLDNLSLVKTDNVTAVTSMLEKVNFEVYPNPVSTSLNFKVEDQARRNFDFFLYSSSGQQIKHLKNIINGDYSINISDLSKGVYLLELRHEEGIKSEQLIVQ